MQQRTALVQDLIGMTKTAVQSRLKFGSEFELYLPVLLHAVFEIEAFAITVQLQPLVYLRCFAYFSFNNAFSECSIRT